MINPNNERETKASPSSATQGLSLKSEMEKSASENTKKEVKPRYCYTKDEMISISKLACSRIRPKCLDNAFNSANGLWNPEKWMTSRNGDNSSSGMRCETAVTGAYKRDRMSDGQDTVKRKTCDQKERIKEELDDEIVLSPQRRSFGTGCHATAFRNENRSQRDNGHQDNRETDHIPHRPRNAAQSRVGSGRLVGRDRGNDWNERNVFDKERSFERTNYKDEECSRKGRYNRYDFDNRRSMNASRNRSYRESRHFEEDEPEWFTSGPTSQNETIELKGFDDSEDIDKLAGLTSESKNRRDSRSHSRSSSHGEFAADEKRPRSRLSNNSNLSGKVTPIDKTAEDSALRAQQAKDYNQEFDINEMFKMDNWKVSSIATVENSISTEANNEDNISANQAGTSRFAQWFSEGKREHSPIEQLFAHPSSQIQSSSPEDLIHFFGKQNTSVRSMSGNISEKEAMYHKNCVRNNEEKDIVNLLQKANINISGIIQNTVPNAHFDANSVKRVSDLEASLKDSPQSENLSGDPALKKTISPGNRTSDTEDASVYEPHNIIDLLKEDDLYAINQQLQSIDNSGNGSLAFQNFAGKYGSQREFLPALRHENYDPKINLMIKHSGNLTVPDIHAKSNKHDFGDQLQYLESPNENLPIRNAAASNIAAFTPTSVIRKFASEKEREGFQKIVENDESSKLIDTSQHHFSVNGVLATQGIVSACVPRPIVKATNLQSAQLVQHQTTNPAVTNSSVYNHAEYDSLAKFIEQQRHQQQQQQAMTAAALTAQRQMNISPMPAATALRLGASRTTNSAIRQTMPNAPISVNQNISVPLIRNMVHATTINPPVRSNTMNPLQFQLLQRGAASLDPRQLQALGQTRGLHPVALQQLLIKAAANIQTHAAAAAAAAAAVSAAQAQAVAVASLGLTGPRPATQPMSPTRPLHRTDIGQVKDGLHDLQNHANIHPNHGLYGHHEMQAQTAGQSPENLTKWFGNEVLNQKLAEMPPVPVQKAVLLEDIERQ